LAGIPVFSSKLCLPLVFSLLPSGGKICFLFSPGNLKENAIEQKLLAVEKRMQHMEGDETGPDQMLDEACQLAAQLHELSNNDSILLNFAHLCFFMFFLV
jgi:hypothetical protein